MKRGKNTIKTCPKDSYPSERIKALQGKCCPTTLKKRGYSHPGFKREPVFKRKKKGGVKRGRVQAEFEKARSRENEKPERDSRKNSRGKEPLQFAAIQKGTFLKPLKGRGGSLFGRERRSQVSASRRRRGGECCEKKKAPRRKKRRRKADSKKKISRRKP